MKSIRRGRERVRDRERLEPSENQATRSCASIFPVACFRFSINFSVIFQGNFSRRKEKFWQRNVKTCKEILKSGSSAGEVIKFCLKNP